jgi:HEAT repeat protein
MPLSDRGWKAAVNDLTTSDDVDRLVAAYTRIADEADESHLRGLYILIEDESFYTREAAAEALARLEGLRALPQLLQALTRGKQDGHDNDGLSTTIVGVLEAYPEKSHALLLPMLQNLSDDVRSNAAWSLGFVIEGKSPTLLLNALQDPSPKVRSAAAGSLGASDPEVVDTLMQMLADEDEQVRVTAAAKLGYLGNPRAIPALQDLLNDKSERVRRFANYALENLSKPPSNRE